MFVVGVVDEPKSPVEGLAPPKILVPVFCVFPKRPVPVVFPVCGWVFVAPKRPVPVVFPVCCWVLFVVDPKSPPVVFVVLPPPKILPPVVPVIPVPALAVIFAAPPYRELAVFPNRLLVPMLPPPPNSDDPVFVFVFVFALLALFPKSELPAAVLVLVLFPNKELPAAGWFVVLGGGAPKAPKIFPAAGAAVFGLVAPKADVVGLAGVFVDPNIEVPAAG